MPNIQTLISRLSDLDLHLFREGSHSRLYELLGAHPEVRDGVAGCHFALWAPNAHAVSVMGEFNDWHRHTHWLRRIHADAGIWEGFVPGASVGQRYKFHIESNVNGYKVDKADPFAFTSEVAPATASIIASLDYQWHDENWMGRRKQANALDAPHSVYEVHLGSWRRSPDNPDQILGYRAIAPQLADYCLDMGFTHVELLPVMEHPFYGSWGYQVTGFFAATSRYGSPQDFMFLIDHLHQRGIGVILDWVPSHFPNDEHGLAYFDGTALYEHADPRQGYHPEWSSQIFNYGRHEVRAFLLSSALFWLDKYHIDGLRVDAVASMLYLDYARKADEWVPNEYGGKENLAAIQFLRQLNEAVYRDFPDTQTIAEESTSWPMVSRPTWLGGLGFGMKWNMGWMHDTLDYYAQDPVHRKHHHDQITFSIWYAFHENFMLPISHDEVVHGKGSLVGKLPGDAWQRFANLRLLLGYMWAHPGKKLLFMGCEFGQSREWNHDTSLDWHLLQYAPHAGVQSWLRDLNACYKTHPALFGRDFSQDGFEWIDCHDSDESVISFLRRGPQGETLLVVINATPVLRESYRVGVPMVAGGGYWRELLNSDADCYGGSGKGNGGGVNAEAYAQHGRPCSLPLRLPPLGVLFLEPA
ncbi:MAG: 1,4-alpha-glucan branching protein GlgB [Gammaproteobacteria bacterium]|nr:1,4-alpha-glucan branching protein GlgB [Rhodocyclaceae bacterium]MBU3908589.1 1,4-alpha-glucan branching protein GlgB [Gammaproteobacteria bacterium]MBU3990464.1 1,4-alpha-glucan branching protein GlgB [Gammaproteobacteria bacterium]MBU4004617.1 1,4-alpha-glucan branching protein GlgB [Gammaproteobacteria bacterium]MBU4021220.1 1,4-alpha-glucan branching protein GlgB [Gammaproteobacteria bacterium]